jgi:hypothetical protein
MSNNQDGSIPVKDNPSLTITSDSDIIIPSADGNLYNAEEAEAASIEIERMMSKPSLKERINSGELFLPFGVAEAANLLLVQQEWLRRAIRANWFVPIFRGKGGRGYESMIDVRQLIGCACAAAYRYGKDMSQWIVRYYECWGETEVKAWLNLPLDSWGEETKAKMCPSIPEADFIKAIQAMMDGKNETGKRYLLLSIRVQQAAKVKYTMLNATKRITR